MARGRLPASWFRVLEVAPLSGSGVATLRGSVPDALRAGERGLTLLFDDPAEGAFPVELDFGAIDQTDWGACL